MRPLIQSIRLKKKSEIEFPCTLKKLYVFEITTTIIYSHSKNDEFPKIRKRIIKDIIEVDEDLSTKDNREIFKDFKLNFNYNLRRM